MNCKDNDLALRFLSGNLSVCGFGPSNRGFMIFKELVDNALDGIYSDASLANGNVCVEIFQINKALCITVSDNGCGLSLSGFEMLGTTFASKKGSSNIGSAGKFGIGLKATILASGASEHIPVTFAFKDKESNLDWEVDITVNSLTKAIVVSSLKEVEISGYSTLVTCPLPLGDSESLDTLREKIHAYLSAVQARRTHKVITWDVKFNMDTIDCRRYSTSFWFIGNSSDEMWRSRLYKDYACDTNVVLEADNIFCTYNNKHDGTEQLAVTFYACLMNDSHRSNDYQATSVSIHPYSGVLCLIRILNGSLLIHTGTQCFVIETLYKYIRKHGAKFGIRMDRGSGHGVTGEEGISNYLKYLSTRIPINIHEGCGWNNMILVMSMETQAQFKGLEKSAVEKSVVLNEANLYDGFETIFVHMRDKSTKGELDSVLDKRRERINELYIPSVAQSLLSILERSKSDAMKEVLGNIVKCYGTNNTTNGHALEKALTSIYERKFTDKTDNVEFVPTVQKRKRIYDNMSSTDIDALYDHCEDFLDFY